MQLQDSHILKVEHVAVDGDEGSDNGMVLVTPNYEILLSESDLQWLLKYCRKGEPPKSSRRSPNAEVSDGANNQKL